MFASTNCPICNSDAPALDVVDLNKNCAEPQGTFLPLSGIPVYYHMCISCGHTFSPMFWDWTDEEFLEHIYNDDYIDVDPDYKEVRPKHNAKLLQDLFRSDASSIRHLDYGGGNGLLASILKERGWKSTSYDPFPNQSLELSQLGKFNLITAFEVFEHVPHPKQLLDNIVQLMDQECVVLFSTLTADNALKMNSRINWWYCSPRNGHISLFTRKSLALLGTQHRLKFGSLNDGFHCYVNQIPSWASHFIQ